MSNSFMTNQNRRQLCVIQILTDKTGCSLVLVWFELCRSCGVWCVLLWLFVWWWWLAFKTMAAIKMTEHPMEWRFFTMSFVDVKLIKWDCPNNLFVRYAVVFWLFRDYSIMRLHPPELFVYRLCVSYIF